MPIDNGPALPSSVAPEQIKIPQPPLFGKRLPDGNGSVKITGELKKWHTLTLDINGPFAHERDNTPNPFLDYKLTATFTNGTTEYTVPGYFAADGNAAETSAEKGTIWRVHFTPDHEDIWTYRIDFIKAKQVAINNAAGSPIEGIHGKTGTFTIVSTDKAGRDLRAKGRLQYVGKHHLRFAETGEYFLKAGADAPETFLAYKEFDGTTTSGHPLKTWSPHIRDWNPGDPVWQKNKGKGIIGALNYLAEKGANAFSFLSYNAGGDGDNVWPFIERNEPFHFDCSKLDQWRIVFDHAQQKGLYLHVKLQETENDDKRGKGKGTAFALDGGKTGPERKLYLREIIARFSHELALNWNLGEENTQSIEEQLAMAEWIKATDPYNHHLVIHTYPNRQNKVYPKLIGDRSPLTGASLQNSSKSVHKLTVKWVKESAKAGRPWVVANDEQGSASVGAPPDTGYQGFDPATPRKYKLKSCPSMHDIRKTVLWGNLMAGGAGVEYYFGYKLPQNDLLCQDWRSREKTWDYSRIALEFFHKNNIPFQSMTNADQRIGNQKHDNTKYCLADPGNLYLIYLPDGGTANIDLTDSPGTFTIQWFNPKTGGNLQTTYPKTLKGGTTVSIGNPPDKQKDDWLAILKKH